MGEEAEEGRVPRTRKSPEWDEPRGHEKAQPYPHPIPPGMILLCRWSQSDHMHPRRDSATAKMQAELESAYGASICADYFFPRDGLGENGVTAVAICDSNSQFLAGHVVDAKRVSAAHATGQVLRGLRKMGHYGNLRVKTEQEASITDL